MDVLQTEIAAAERTVAKREKHMASILQSDAFDQAKRYRGWRQVSCLRLRWRANVLSLGLCIGRV